jgi:signal-transduction protein with cAMP-binding, CBS, and nucleotidyltransferase domain
MQVRDAMTSTVLTLGPEHTLREAARQMAKRRVGAAVIIDPDQPGPGIFTERDLLESVGAGEDPDTALIAEHLSTGAQAAAPDWSLEEAAAAMLRAGFRHLVVSEDGDTVGVVSMRDIVRCWTGVDHPSAVR